MSFKNKKKHKLKNFGVVGKLNKLEEARFLIEGGKLFEALGFLEDAVRQYPSEARFWELLAAVSNEVKDVPMMQKAFARLIQFQPRNADAHFGLAYAYALDSRLALGVRGFREFLRKFPDSEYRTEAAELLEMGEKDLRRNLAEFDFPEGETGLELACLHEEAQISMQRHQFDEAKKKAEKLIREMPEFVSAYNNLSLILFMDGDAVAAAETAKKVLEKQPENFHALANLVRFSVFLGKPEEARNFANRLRPIENDNPDLWIKKIEAFTFAGDDKAVTEIYKESNKRTDFVVPDSFGKHLAAFAFYELGKHNQARKIWQEILDEEPNNEFAALNMAEIHLAENERNVFALPASYWIPARYVNELMAETSKIKEGRNFEKNLQKKTAQFFEKHPNIPHVLSILLERGDLFAKDFAVKLLSWAQTPESIAALKEFAFGQKGSDKFRYQAAMQLAETGAIPGKVRLWNDGDWREMMLMTFEITDEPMDAYSMKPKAQNLLKQGLMAMQKKNYDLAGQYFQMALEANGAEHPSLLYNVLTIKRMKDKSYDFEDGLREIVQKFPEYSFAAITLATSEVRKGNIETAKNLVERFYDKKKWHFSEIKNWFYFNLEMALAEKHFDSARMSLDMLRQFDENLDEKYWEERISMSELLNKLSSLPDKLPGRRKKKK